jgi:hypothetical protein
MCVLISTVLQKDCSPGMQAYLILGGTLHSAQAPQNLMHICCKATTTEQRPQVGH